MLLNAQQAATKLHGGEVVAYPTEAVFGLGCDPSRSTAIQRVLSLKHRPVSAGLILIAADIGQLEGWVGPVSADLLEQANKTWPGPVTWLFPRGPKATDQLAGDHETIAVRVSAHQPCIDLCNAFGGPLVSTSANPRSAPPARSAGEVEDYFGSFLGGILEGPLGGQDQPSEIRDLATGKVLRTS